NGVNPLALLERLARSRDGEEVLRGGSDKIWFRRKGLHQVGMIQPVLKLVGELLLRVLWTRAQELVFPIGDIAGRGGYLQPFVQSSQIGGERAAARAARYANALRIYIGERFQQVNAP